MVQTLVDDVIGFKLDDFGFVDPSLVESTSSLHAHSGFGTDGFHTVVFAPTDVSVAREPIEHLNGGEKELDLSRSDAGFVLRGLPLLSTHINTSAPVIDSKPVSSLTRVDLDMREAVCAAPTTGCDGGDVSCQAVVSAPGAGSRALASPVSQGVAAVPCVGQGDFIGSDFIGDGVHAQRVRFLASCFPETLDAELSRKVARLHFAIRRQDVGLADSQLRWLADHLAGEAEFASWANAVFRLLP